MKVTPRAALAAASAVALLAVGAFVGTSAFAQDAGAGNDASTAAAPNPAPATITPTLEDTYVPVTPCRIVDGRKALGVVPAGTVRSYEVRGTTGFVPQGGTSGGCGIPTYASAVTFTVSVVSPSGGGFLRAWPEGKSEPNATLMNIVAGQSQTTTAPIALGDSSLAKDLRVKSYAADSMLVIDVQGYYAPQIQAHVGVDGSLVSGSPRVVSATRTTTGTYQVTLDRNVSECAAEASPDGSGGFIASASPAGTTVTVYTYNLTGTATNIRFTLNVTC